MRKVPILLFVLFFSTSALIANAQGQIPLAPQSFIATPISACAIELSWNQPDPGANFFTYYQSTNNFTLPNNGYSTRIPENGNLPNAPVSSAQKIKVTQFRNTNLIANNEYWYKLESCNENGCSSKVSSGSENIRTKTLPQTPVKPTITRARATEDQNATTQYVDLEWNAVNGLTSYGGYLIYKSTNGGAYEYLGFNPLYAKDASGLVTYSRGEEALKYRIINLSMSGSHAFYVKAYDSDFNCITGDPTSVGSQKVVSTESNSVIVPRKPSNLSFSSVTGANANIKISWQDESIEEQSFEILRSTNQTFPIDSTRSFTVSRDQEEFVDREIQPNTTYYYKIRACSLGNICSTFTTELAASAGLTKPALSAPRVLFTKQSTGKAKIMLVWEEAVSATGYKVFRGTSEDQMIEIISTNDILEYDTPPLGQKYYYQIKAVKGTEEVASEIQEVNLKINLFLRGSAWSGAGSLTTGPKGPGWVNFRDVRSANNKYSVQIDEEGLVSGLAWMDDRYGWLSFNKEDLTGCPSGTCEAVMNITTGNLSGWGRFFTRRVDSSAGAWTGWLKLSGSNYGVRYDTSKKRFLGQAWGGDVVGWVAMNRRDSCKKIAENEEDCDTRLSQALKEWNVRASEPKPEVSNLITVVGPEGVEWCAETPYYKISWIYAGEEPQTQAEVKFIEVNGNGTKDYTDTVTGNATTTILTDPLSVLAADTSYIVRVRVSDGEQESEWVETPAFKTPTNYYPLIDFTWEEPVELGAAEEFTGTVERIPNITPPPELNYAWDIEEVNSVKKGTFAGSVNETTVSVIFDSLPSDLTFIVRDVNGDGCAITREVTREGGGGRDDRPPSGGCDAANEECERYTVDDDDVPDGETITDVIRRRRIRER